MSTTTNVKQYPITNTDETGMTTIQYSDKVRAFEDHQSVTFVFMNEDIKVRIQKPAIDIEEPKMSITTPLSSYECDMFNLTVSHDKEYLQNCRYNRLMFKLGKENIGYLVSHRYGLMAIDTLGYCLSEYEFFEMAQLSSELEYDEDNMTDIDKQLDNNLKIKLIAKKKEILAKCVGNNPLIENEGKHANHLATLEHNKYVCGFADCFTF